MITVEFKECKIFRDSLHVNRTCGNKYDRCWRDVFPKEYLRSKKELYEKDGIMIINKQFMEDNNETKS